MHRRVWRLPSLLVLTAAACGAPAPPAEGDVSRSSPPTLDFSGGDWVDLTHPFSVDAVYWPTASEFRLDTVAWGPTPGGYFYSAFDFTAAEHGGTHLDAPLHFAEGRQAADEIPLERLIAPAVVVDVRDRVHADYQVTVEDLLAWEATHGRIPGGSILLLRTGWGERYGNALAYLGTERRGPEAVADLHFPGLHPDGARWLVRERRTSAVGIDTASLDHGQSTNFETHVTLYSENIPGFENVANLEALPPTGAHVFALPMKIRGGSGGPLRIVAWVPR